MTRRRPANARLAACARASGRAALRLLLVMLLWPGLAAAAPAGRALEPHEPHEPHGALEALVTAAASVAPRAPVARVRPVAPVAPTAPTAPTAPVATVAALAPEPARWPSPTDLRLSVPAPADCAALGRALAPGAVLDLPQALARAACGSPELARALAGVALQRAALDQARSASWPVLSADASVSGARNTGSLGSDGQVVSEGANSFGLGLTARWVLFDFGRRAAERSRAGQELSAAEADRDAAALALAGLVLRGHTEATVAEARAGLRAQAHQVARRSLAVVQRLQTAGVSAAPDVLRAQALVAERHSTWLRARGQASAARAALAPLLGLRSLPAEALPDPQAVLPGVGEPLDAEAWVARARQLHPLQRAADARVRAAAAAADSVRAQGRGSVSLSASVGTARVAELSTAAATNSRSERAGLTLSLPLFDGGSNSAQLQQALARQRALQAGADAAGLQIEQAVRREAEAWLAARDVLAAADNALATAREAEDAARTRYAARVGALSELLLAQQALVDADLARLDSIAEWTDVQWRLLAAAGQLI